MTRPGTMTNRDRDRLAAWHTNEEVEEAAFLGRRIAAYYGALVGGGVPVEEATRLAGRLQDRLTDGGCGCDWEDEEG